jgi:hypothetical protein
LDEFFSWSFQQPRPGFTKATMTAWRAALDARGLSAVSIPDYGCAELAGEAADKDCRDRIAQHHLPWEKRIPSRERFVLEIAAPSRT